MDATAKRIDEECGRFNRSGETDTLMLVVDRTDDWAILYGMHIVTDEGAPGTYRVACIPSPPRSHRGEAQIRCRCGRTSTDFPRIFLRRIQHRQPTAH